MYVWNLELNIPCPSTEGPSGSPTKSKSCSVFDCILKSYSPGVTPWGEGSSTPIQVKPPPCFLSEQRYFGMYAFNQA